MMKSRTASGAFVLIGTGAGVVALSATTGVSIPITGIAHTIRVTGTDVVVSDGSEDTYVLVLMR